MSRQNKSGIPYPSKDPRYRQVWYLIRSGVSLQDAIGRVDQDTNTPGSVTSPDLVKPESPENGSIPEPDPDGYQGMILDVLTNIHGDLKEINHDLKEVARELKMFREGRTGTW